MRDADLDLKSFVRDDQDRRNQFIRYGTDQRPIIFQKITLALDTARSSSDPLKVSFPFVSVFMREATDSTAEISLMPIDNGIDRVDSALALRKNDAFDFKNMIPGGQLFWTAQAGKSVTLIFSTMGAMKPGAQLSQIAGGVSVSDGSSISSAKLSSTGAAPTVTVTTAATQICATDTDRKVLTFYFPADCWVGDASVAVGTRGVYQPAGQLVYKNTAALYAIAVSGSVVVTGNQEN